MTNAPAAWRVNGLAQLLAEHGSLPLRVVRGQATTNWYTPFTYESSLREFASSLVRSPRDDYVFNYVSNTSIATGWPELCDLFAQASCHWKSDFCKAPLAARGALNLLVGGEGSTNAFHTHGPGLNLVLEGRKRWYIKRPYDQVLTRDRAELQQLSLQDVLSGAHERLLLPSHVWQCAQRAGQLMWIPDGLEHGVSNEGAQVVALATQFGQVSSMALHEAAKWGLGGDVHALLDAGTPVDGRNRAGKTALLEAATPWHRGDASNIVRMLLKAGADVAGTDHEGQTALDAAASAGQLESCRALLEAGATVLRVDPLGQTALTQAAFGGHAEVAGLLIDSGAEVNAASHQGQTALHVAAFSGHTEVLHVLIEAGADVNARDVQQGTALHFAAFNNHMEVARMLIEAGADVDARELGGSTALQLASEGKADVRLMALLGHDAPKTKRRGGRKRKQKRK